MAISMHSDYAEAYAGRALARAGLNDRTGTISEEGTSRTFVPKPRRHRRLQRDSTSSPTDSINSTWREITLHSTGVRSPLNSSNNPRSHSSFLIP